MKKVALVFALVLAVFISGCNSNKSVKEKSKTDNPFDNQDDLSANDEPSDDADKLATAYCNCYTENGGDPSKKLRKIILKVSKMDFTNLPVAINDELVEVAEGGEEQMQLANEFADWAGNKGMVSCINDAKEQFGIAGGGSAKLRDAVYDKLEESEDCALLATFLKMKLKARQKE